eukprot:6603337-Prymnesium_polylepis.1
MYAGATADGWMDEASKLEWYMKARAAPGCPFADVSRRTIDQRDQHYSNDSIAQSQMQEQDNNIGLGTPGHHTAALQHMDQRGGPIQHANRILRPLLRREQRAKGEITIPRMMRLIEIAVAASHTPKIFSYAARRVGWHEDETGKLCYDPMATCDKSVLTTPVAPSLGAAAQVGSIGFSPAAAGPPGLVATAATPAAAHASPAAVTTLAIPAAPGVHRSSVEFLSTHTSAGKLAADTLSNLFTSAVGGSDESEGEDAEAQEGGGGGGGGRKGKGGGRKCQKGAIISRAERRAGKEEVAEQKKVKAQKAKDGVCEKFERVRGVLREYAALTSKYPFLAREHTLDEIRSAKPKITVPMLKMYIEVRSTEKQPSQMSEKVAVEKVASWLNKPVHLQEGSIPEGYEEWKEREHERLQLAAAPGAAPGAAPLAITMAPAAAAAPAAATAAAGPS